LKPLFIIRGRKRQRKFPWRLLVESMPGEQSLSGWLPGLSLENLENRENLQNKRTAGASRRFF
jgi:hypothetical protein